MQVGRPRALFDARPYENNFAVSPDGQRLLMMPLAWHGFSRKGEGNNFLGYLTNLIDWIGVRTERARAVLAQQQELASSGSDLFQRNSN